MADWKEAGSSKNNNAISDNIEISELRLVDNQRYQSLLKECNNIHKQLLTYESTNKANSYVDNPSLIGEYLGKLRLNANQLFLFMNIYIDLISEMELEYAKKRQKVYIEQLEIGSVNSAEKSARELTRVDEAQLGVVKNSLNQIRNNYEQFNGICIYLQSRLKEFTTEKLLG